jgi:hypothetical protein
MNAPPLQVIGGRTTEAEPENTTMASVFAGDAIEMDMEQYIEAQHNRHNSDPASRQLPTQTMEEATQGAPIRRPSFTDIPVDGSMDTIDLLA